MLPNFVGIGAPKAGTTWLAKCLEAHPEVFVPSVKETMFFCAYEKWPGLDRYEAFFAGAEDFKAVGELTATYFGLKFVARIMHDYLPEVKLFVSLRHPVEQMYSNYWHLRRQNFHAGDRSNCSFEEAIARYPKRLLDPARYATNLERWIAEYGRDRIQVIFYDDICARPRDVLKDLFAFLDVDPDFVPPFLEQRDDTVRQGVSPKNKALGKLHASVYDSLNKYAYQPTIALIGEQRAAQLKDALQVRRWMQKIFYKTGYPRLSAAARQQTITLLADEIDRLAELTDRDLSHWKR